jgi:cell wall-associated NlpC family hydrolase
MERGKFRRKAVTIAELEAKKGVREVGGNNRGPRVQEYQKATWLSGTGWPWCMAFVQWCFREAGLVLPNRTASVGEFAAWADKVGAVVQRPFRGDVVCFNFDSNDWPDHIGFVSRVLSLRPTGFYLLKTVEGNTSGDDFGSQDDGGGVYFKRRLVRRNRVVFARVLDPEIVIRVPKKTRRKYEVFDGTGL